MLLLSNGLVLSSIRHYDGALSPKMVNCCSVFGCSNRSDREKDRSFHRLLKLITHLDEQMKEHSAERRSKWLSNIRQGRIQTVATVAAATVRFPAMQTSLKSSVSWNPVVLYWLSKDSSFQSSQNILFRGYQYLI